MESLLLWALAAYGGVAACYSVLTWWYGNRPPQVEYYFLTLNSEEEIEWLIRSSTQRSRLEGRDFRLIVIDSGSIDDTMAIIDRFRRRGLRIELLNEKDQPSSEDDQPSLLSSSADSPLADRDLTFDPRGGAKEIKVIDLRRRQWGADRKQTKHSS